MTRPIELEKTYYHGLIKAKKIIEEFMATGKCNNSFYKNWSICRALAISIIDKIDNEIYTWEISQHD